MEHQCFVCGKDIDGKVWSKFGICEDCMLDLGSDFYIYTKLAKSIHREDRYGHLKEYLSNAVMYIVCIPLLFFIPAWLHRWIASEVLCFILGLVVLVGVGVLISLLCVRLKGAWGKTGSQAEESRVQAILKENETLYYAIKNCEDLTPYRELINQRSTQAQKEHQTKEKRKDIIIKIIAYVIVGFALFNIIKPDKPTEFKRSAYIARDKDSAQWERVIAHMDSQMVPVSPDDEKRIYYVHAIEYPDSGKICDADAQYTKDTLNDNDVEWLTIYNSYNDTSSDYYIRLTDEEVK